MTTEAPDSADELPAGTPEDEEAAMLSSFAESRGEDPPVTTDPPPEPPTDPPTEPPTEPPPATDPEPVTLDQALARIDALERLHSEADAAAKADIRRLHGRIGSLNGVVAELRKTPVFTKESLADLRAEYPDIADMVGKHLPDTHTPPELPTDDAPPATTDDDDPSTTGAEPITLPPEQQEYILEQVAPGWREKVTSEPFAAWLGAMPPGEREAIESSNDPRFVAETVKKFDTWTAAETARRETDAEKAARLEAATPPNTGAHAATPEPQDEETWMNVGWKDVAGQRL